MFVRKTDSISARVAVQSDGKRACLGGECIARLLVLLAAAGTLYLSGLISCNIVESPGQVGFAQ